MSTPTEFVFDSTSASEPAPAPRNILAHVDAISQMSSRELGTMLSALLRYPTTRVVASGYSREVGYLVSEERWTSSDFGRPDEFHTRSTLSGGLHDMTSERRFLYAIVPLEELDEPNDEDDEDDEDDDSSAF